jgi:hypothetical protein
MRKLKIMSIRKRNDSEGWKRGEGAFSKEVQLRNAPPLPRNPETSAKGEGAYTSDADGGLVRSDDFEHGASSRQIWSDTDKNSSDDGDRGIRAGVNRSQKR